MSDYQEMADRFFITHGPCCAGCDWWHSTSSLIGECRRSAPVPSDQRHRMVGLTWNTLTFGADDPGHLLTRREHRCGDFKDEFDWSTLPAHYLRKIGKTVGISHTAPPWSAWQGSMTSLGKNHEHIRDAEAVPACAGAIRR